MTSSLALIQNRALKKDILVWSFYGAVKGILDCEPHVPRDQLWIALRKLVAETREAMAGLDKMDEEGNP